MEAELVRYQFYSVEVQPAAFCVLRDGRHVDLEPKAIRVLLYLIEHRDRAVTKDELVETVWGATAVTDNALTRIIAQIRRELGDDAHHARYIQTLPTMGYRFVAEPKVLRTVTSSPPLSTGRSRTPRLVSAVILAVLGLGVAVWLWTHKSASRMTGEMIPVQLTTSAGLDIGASFSPDGNSFVYCSNRSGRFEIYRRSVTSASDEIQITNDGKQNIEPAWSPDGRQIAYHSVSQHGIWLVPVSGGTPRRLTSFGSAPAWSPDGQRVAFRSTEPVSFAWGDLGGAGPSTLWTVASDGSQLREVTTLNNPPGQQAMPVWNPDGKQLVFVAMTPQSAIWNLDLASGRLDALVKVGRDIPKQPGTWFTRLADPRFGPSGNGLYFSAMSGLGAYAIFFRPRSGGHPLELYPTHGEVPSGITLSPDGKRLLFTRVSGTSQLWKYTPDADPKPLFQEAVLRVSLPRVSPDGKHLACMVELAGRNREIWVMNIDGTGATPVSRDPGTMEGGNIWNLSGDGLLYNYVVEKKIEFRRYDVARKTNQVLYSLPLTRDLFHPVLTPDEREVLSACSKPFNICLSRPEGGPPRQITFEREGALYPSPSGDGSWIAFNLRRGDTVQIGLLDRQTGRQEVLTSDPGLSWAHSFSADNRRIAFAAYRDGVWNLWWIDRVTRERKQLTHHTAYGSFVRSPAWRYGTEEIIYENLQMRGNVYLLNLP
ncbi:MAG: winged helix-turn-helix domain-containing protein [Acidobacteriales bacterium]|nr:winged helix-turn-helix domain-containing protein [Terriglobales bacterium]